MLLPLLLLGALPLGALGALFPAGSPVVQLDGANFKREVLAIDKPTLVAFTAPWCGHCQRLVPEYVKAASSLAGIVKLANIDCDAEGNKQTCAKYAIQGFPTLKLFPATKKRLPKDYTGERSAKAIATYAAAQLPQAAKKLAADSLLTFVTDEPSKPKVILFTTKSVSSPLLRSLALDFRTRVPFGFARGDEALVRSHARMDLGLDIPTANDLPMLLMFPGRADDDAVSKGQFETYVGKLKYVPMKAWLDETAAKLGAAPPAQSGSAGKKRSPAKEKKEKEEKAARTEAARAAAEQREAKKKHKAAAARQRKAQEAAKHASENIPDGAAVEWKAKKGDKLPPIHRRDQEGNVIEDLDKEDVERLVRESGGQMLTKDKAEGLLKELEAQQEREERAKKRFESGEDAHSAGEGAAEAIKSAFGTAFNFASEGAEALADGARAGLGSIAEALGSAGKLDSETGPFAAKRRALMKSFERWMAGENPDWAEEYGEDFRKAQLEAQELIRTDPVRAEQEAWRNEAWLLEELKTDRERMRDVMTKAQRDQVEGMIDLIEGRLAKRRVVGGAAEDAPRKAHDEL